MIRVVHNTYPFLACVCNCGLAIVLLHSNQERKHTNEALQVFLRAGAYITYGSHVALVEAAFVATDPHGVILDAKGESRGHVWMVGIVFGILDKFEDEVCIGSIELVGQATRRA